MRPTRRRRLARACRLAAALVVAVTVALALLVAASQPVCKRAWRPGKGIVYDRPAVSTVVEVGTGRTWSVAPGGQMVLTRGSDR